jgi:hypothetical protein
MQLTESFSLKARPSLQFQFYTNKYKEKLDYKDYEGETSWTDQAPVFEFQFNPVMQIGAQYAYKKISLYGGTKVTFFTLNTQSTSKWTDDADVEYKDTPSQWQVTRLEWADTTLDLAAEFNFNEKVGLEMGFTTPLLSIGMPGTDATTSISNPIQAAGLLTTGNLLLKIKR